MRGGWGGRFDSISTVAVAPPIVIHKLGNQVVSTVPVFRLTKLFC